VRPPARLLTPALACLWRELARRLARGDRPSSLRLTGLDAAERAALADLFGSARAIGPRYTVPITRLSDACGVDGLDELTGIAEALFGPIDDRSLARAAERRARDELWSTLHGALSDLPSGAAATGVVQADAIERFVAAQRLAGVASDELETRRYRYRQLVAVLERLPTAPHRLAPFAAEVLGDPHALDADRALSRLCLDAVHALHGAPLARDAATLRDAWAHVGVSTDAVSSNVLVLGLTAPPGHPLRNWLEQQREAAEPVWLTARQLARWPLRGRAVSDRVRVVENPSVIEAFADAARVDPPMVCSMGQPSVAVARLVRQLALGGARIEQHADFDTAGIRITRWFARELGAMPWQMDEAHYRRALLMHVADDVAFRLPGLNGTPDETPWSPGLRSAMAEADAVVSEELVAASLLDAD